MRAGGRIAVTAVATGTMALGLTAGAEAKRGDCVRNAPDGAVQYGQPTGQAMLFQHRGKVYGCAYNRGLVRELPGQHAEEDATNKLQLRKLEFERRWVAYGRVWRHDNGDDTGLIVHSFNLRTFESRQSKNWDGAVLGSLVLKNNGSIAWIYTFPRGGPRQFARVAKIDRTTLPGEAQVGTDAGSSNKIHADSLELRPGGTQVEWDRDSGGGSAPLQ